MIESSDRVGFKHLNFLWNFKHSEMELMNENFHHLPCSSYFLPAAAVFFIFLINLEIILALIWPLFGGILISLPALESFPPISIFISWIKRERSQKINRNALFLRKTELKSRFKAKMILLKWSYKEKRLIWVKITLFIIQKTLLNKEICVLCLIFFFLFSKTVRKGKMAEEVLRVWRRRRRRLWKRRHVGAPYL